MLRSLLSFIYFNDSVENMPVKIRFYADESVVYNLFLYMMNY